MLVLSMGYVSGLDFVDRCGRDDGLCRRRWSGRPVRRCTTPVFSSRAELVVSLAGAMGAHKRLAAATGGDSFFPRDVNAVDDVLQRIARDIRHSYTRGYVSSNSARDGQFRRIRVVVTGPARRAVRVRTRDGYRGSGASQGR
jgi:VWFA-related protein